MSIDSEDGPFSNEDSQLIDGENSRGFMGGIILKKGPWTSAEDAILIDYVKKHGEGNWNAVQKHSGLFRCGKSCRLRWANHLRPNLKKGPFTAEEERLIIELHAKMGNKWARMAAHLPGRTDNEIKNYWNTRIKRRQRAGLSLCPQEACLHALLKSTGDDPLRMNSRGNGYSNTNYDAPDVILHNMSASHDAFPYFRELAGESPDNMLFEAIGSSRQSNFALSQQPKRYCGSRGHEYGSELVVKKELYSLEPVQDNPQVKSAGYIFPYGRDPGDPNWLVGVIQDSHSLVHCNFSTPKPACEAVKSELPSFQYPDTDSSNWDTSYSASPLLDPFESNIHSGTPNETVHSACSSPRNSGLLEALLYEARTISGVKNQSSKKSSNSSAVTPIDFADETGPKFCETEIRNNNEPISPLDSATSIYSGSAFTAAHGTVIDSHTFKETYSECKLKCEPNDSVINPFEENIPAGFDSLDPSMASYTDWLEQESCFTMEEAVAEARESHNELATDLRYIGSKIPGRGWGVGSYIWNNMPTVRQTSNLP